MRTAKRVLRVAYDTKACACWGLAAESAAPSPATPDAAYSTTEHLSLTYLCVISPPPGLRVIFLDLSQYEPSRGKTKNLVNF